MKSRKQFYLLCLFLFAIILSACANESTVTSTPSAETLTLANGFACPAPEFPTEITSTELNIFVWTEYISRDMRECFELVYGIKINQQQYSSTDKMLEKLSTDAEEYDLVLPKDYAVPSMVRQGLLQELDHSKLPLLKNIDQSYLDFYFDPGNKYTIPYLAGTDAIVVNTNVVKNIPLSWADLWKPEYAGRLVLLEESRTIIGMALLSLGYDVNTSDPTQLAEAEQQLRKLIPSVLAFDSDSPSNMLIQEQAYLGVTWTGEAVIAQRINPAIRYVFPDEGVIIWQDNWAMLADAPHVDAAYAWLNYTMQANVAWLTIRDWPYTTPNKAALDFARENSMKVLDRDGSDTTLSSIYEEYRSSPITIVPANVLARGHRITDVGESAGLYQQVWERLRGD